MQSTMSALLREPPSETLRRKLFSSLLWARPMGGGPRTFPDGLNKCQWKRLHEKKARLRSQIRVSVSSRPGPEDGPAHSPSHSPLSPRDHVRALAHRFVKPGAEDLWNDADGPVHSPARPDSKPCDVSAGSRRRVMDGGVTGNFQQKRCYCSTNSANFRAEKLVDDGVRGNLMGTIFFHSNSLNNQILESGNLSNLRVLGGNLEQKRGFASKIKREIKPRVYKKRSGGSSSDDDEDFGVVSKNARWPRFSVEGAGKGKEEEAGERGRGGLRSARGFIGSGVLGKHDVKISRRRIVKELEDYAEKEEGEGLRERVEEIRQEVMYRKMVEKAREENEVEDESVGDFVPGEKRCACFCFS